MTRTNFYILFALIVASLISLQGSGTEINAQQVERSVFGSGGNAISDGFHRINGTISQSTVGITRRDFKHGVGFWYNARNYFSINNGALVFIPKLTGETGSVIDIPIFIEYNNSIKRQGGRTFTMKVQFNSTILVPFDKNNVSYSDLKGSITINGSLPEDTTGLLTEFKAQLKLGNDIFTDLEITEFTIHELERVDVVSKRGRIDLLDICKEGDTIRLIRRANTEGIASIFPNPAKNFLNLDLNLNSSGSSIIYISDASGSKCKTINSSLSHLGQHSFAIDISDLPDGAYFMVLQTPNDIFTRKFLINK